jgi:hypothetical protein
MCQTKGRQRMIFCTPTVLHACRGFGARCRRWPLFFRSRAILFSRAHDTLRRVAEPCCAALGMPHGRPVITHSVCHAVCHSVCHSDNLWRCMPVPVPAPAPPPAPVPSPSLQGGDGMRYTSHQPEMLTTPASSHLTPSPIHNPRRFSLNCTCCTS